MGEELYDKEVARRICAQIEFGEYFDVRDDGVFIKKDFVDNDPGEPGFYLDTCVCHGKLAWRTQPT
jgi:hypothetical protein